jgi:hypothetical protein
LVFCINLTSTITEKIIAAGIETRKLEIISGGVIKPENKKIPEIPNSKILTDLRNLLAYLLVI